MREEEEEEEEVEQEEEEVDCLVVIWLDPRDQTRDTPPCHSFIDSKNSIYWKLLTVINNCTIKRRSQCKINDVPINKL